MMNGIPTIEAGAERRLRECIAAWIADHETKHAGRESIHDDSAAGTYGRQAHMIATEVDHQVEDLGTLLQLWRNHFPDTPFPGVPFARLKSLHERLGTMLKEAGVRCQMPETGEENTKTRIANDESRTTNSETQIPFFTPEVL